MKKIIFVITVIIVLGCVSIKAPAYADSYMPFYDLQPKDIVLRSEFSTYYGTSSIERKHNIELSLKALNGVFVDVNGEFSFNKTVGNRTEKRGYQKSKIILDGKFADGIGGGVCQVSTTLYNAVLLSDLKITEYHPHSLPVSYIEPSFDAMVNSGSADLRFINNTHNPVYIKTYADGEYIKISVYGENAKYKIIRESEITEEIESEFEKVLDKNGEYGLQKGEKKILSYGKNGYRSEGYIIKQINGKTVSKKIIRKDKYNAVRGVEIEGVGSETDGEILVI